MSYPHLVFSHGIVPDEAPPKKFDQADEEPSDMDSESWEDNGYSDDEWY